MTNEISNRRINLLCGILNNFLEFSKRLNEIAIEAGVSYEEIWLCWKEQRDTAGII